MKYIKVIILFFISCFQIFAQCDDADKTREIRNLDASYFQSPFGAVVIKGEYGIWRKRFGNITEITKPFIICEGFDPTGSMELGCIYESINSRGDVNFLEYLRRDGFDIIILNLKTNGIEIEKNARLFAMLMNDIRQELQANGSTHKPVVMGISMGGLITRIALARMGNGASYFGFPMFYGTLKADVEKYISFDAPHKGANVPLGYGHMVSTILEPFLLLNQISTLLPNEINPLRLINSFTSAFNLGFEQAAPLQMVMNYYANNPKRSLFRAELSEAGYPNVYRRIGIANGSWNRSKQSNLNQGTQMLNWNGGLCLFDKEFDTRIIGKVYISFCPIKIDIRAYAMPGNNLGMVSRVFVGSKIGVGLSDFNNVLANRYAVLHDYLNAPVNKNVDHVPGGVYGIYPLEELATSINAIRRIPIRYQQRLKFKFVIDFDILVFEINETIDNPLGTIQGAPFNFSFVPTVSALDINTNDWFYNASSLGNYPRGRSVTPFDAIYANNENNTHAFMEASCNNSGSMADFMLSEISPMNLKIQNRTFPANYTNTFEARGNITLGRNVDTEPNRSDVGNVQMSNGGNILFSVGATKQVIFEDGFDSGNSTFDIIENNLPNVAPTFGDCTNNPKSSRARKSLVSEDENYLYNLDTEEDIEIEKETNDEQFKYSIYPNPFSESTKLEFSLIEDTQLSVKILSANLNLISTLVDNQFLAKGTYTYDFKSSNLPNGLYFVQIETPKGNVMGKIVLSR